MLWVFRVTIFLRDSNLFAIRVFFLNAAHTEGVRSGVPMSNLSGIFSFPSIIWVFFGESLSLSVEFTFRNWAWFFLIGDEWIILNSENLLPKVLLELIVISGCSVFHKPFSVSFLYFLSWMFLLEFTLCLLKPLNFS